MEKEKQCRRCKLASEILQYINAGALVALSLYIWIVHIAYTTTHFILSVYYFLIAFILISSQLTEKVGKFNKLFEEYEFIGRFLGKAILSLFISGLTFYGRTIHLCVFGFLIAVGIVDLIFYFIFRNEEKNIIAKKYEPVKNK